MIGNLLNVSERLVSAPNVTSLNIGDYRVGASVAVRVERVGAQEGVDIRPREWTWRFRRNVAADISAASFDDCIWIKRDYSGRLLARIEFNC